MSDTKEPSAPSPAEAGGSDESSPSPPVYPEMPAFQARPDKVLFQQTLATLDVEIKTLTEKRTKMQTALRDAEAGGGDVREARTALMTQLRELTTAAKALRKEKGALLDQRQAFWDKQKKTREQLKKMRDELGKHTELASIEAAISRLHYRQSTGSMTLNEEKKMMAELADLNKMKGSVAVYAEMVAQEKKKGGNGRGIGDLLSAKSAEVAELSSKINDVKAQLEVLDAKKDKKRGKIKPLREELDSVRKEIDDKYTMLKNLRSNWKKDNDRYFDYMKKVKVVKAQIRKIDDEYYEAQRAEARRLREEEEAKLKPWLEEMALCDTLIKYLNGMRPKPAEEFAPETEEAPAAPNGFGGTMISKKQQALLDGGMFVGTSKSKKRGKKKKRMAKQAAAHASAEQPIRHDMKALGDFAYLAKHSKKPLQMPSSTGDIDATIESLEAIKAYYDVLPRATKKKKVEKKKGTAGKGEGGDDEEDGAGVSVGEDMDTPYGKAKVSAYRDDGVVVASLAWGKLYIQA